MSPLRALAGAAVAVAGVALGIGALLTVTEEPGGSPTVAAGTTGSGPGAAPAEDLAGGDARVPADDLPAVPAPVAAAPSPIDLPAAPAAAPTAPAAPVRAARTAGSEAAGSGSAGSGSAGSASAGSGTSRAALRPPVTVLNNSTRTGLADRAARRFTRAGWPVRLTGNFRGQLRATTVYYEAGQRAAAQRFAQTFRGVPRVLPRPSNIPGPRGLVVVLTRDFPA